MKKIFNYIVVALAAVACLSVASCKEDDDNMSRAVLASTDVLEYVSMSAAPQTITVTSDADWTSVASEWVSIVPASGKAGQTEVEISVADNIVGGAEGNPRKMKVEFKGRDLRSTYEVLVKQDGDKFRDLPVISLTDVNEAEDGTTLSVANVVVAKALKDGFVATDGTEYVYFANSSTPVAEGNTVAVMGDKGSFKTGIPFMNAERVTVGSNAQVPTSEALEPADVIGIYSKPVYMIARGTFDGSYLKIPNTKYSAVFEDMPAGMSTDDVKSHIIEAKGYYLGASSNEIHIAVAEITDLGMAEKVYFEDDFSWMEPWVAIGNGKGRCEDQVGNQTSGGNCPQLQSCLVDGVSAYDALLAKGYDFIFRPSSAVSGTHTAKECTYLMDSYLKINKTSYYAALVLPKLDGVQPNAELDLLFDWCPMITGSGNFDSTELVVIVKNGDTEEQVQILNHTLVNKQAMFWMHPVVSLKGYHIDENTRIIIRNSDKQWPKEDGSYATGDMFRWFVDNIKVREVLK